MLTMKNIKLVNKLTNTANKVILLAARGPKCLVTTSMHKNDNQETNIPPSRAIQVSLTIVLFASKFIAMTETTKKATTYEGMLLNNSLLSLA